MYMVTLPSLGEMEILKISFQESPWLDVRPPWLLRNGTGLQGQCLEEPHAYNRGQIAGMAVVYF